jgi:hypothetical protein
VNNKTLVIIGVGCIVVLCLCTVVSAAGFWWMSQQSGMFEGIVRSLGGEPGGMGGIVPPPTGAPGLPGKLPTGIAPVGSTKAAPPSSGASGNPFTDFMNKTKTANKYRVEFVWTFGSTDQGKYQEVSFFNMTGEVDGTKSRFVSKGGLMAMLGGDQNATVEFIEADGKSYVKGMAIIPGLDPKAWYITDDKMSSGFRDYAKPDEFKNFTGGKDTDFKKVRTESLDGQSCEVWLYDFKNIQNAAITSALAMGKDKNEFSVIDAGQSAVWLCSDGFVHKWNFELRGHDTKNPNEKGALIMGAHMWDFNNPTIVVTAPAGAKPMPGK